MSWPYTPQFCHILSLFHIFWHKPRSWLWRGGGERRGVCYKPDVSLFGAIIAFDIFSVSYHRIEYATKLRLFSITFPEISLLFPCANSRRTATTLYVFLHFYAKHGFTYANLNDDKNCDAFLMDLKVFYDYRLSSHLATVNTNKIMRRSRQVNRAQK